MDPETHDNLTRLYLRGQIASTVLKAARFLAEDAQQAAERAQQDLRDAEREYQKVQEEIHSARFHDVGHLSSYLNGDGTKYGPLKESTHENP